MIARLLEQTRRGFCKVCPYEFRKGSIVFHNGRYAEILNYRPSTNSKLRGMYKVELLDLFTNGVNKEYLSFPQIEKLDCVEFTKLDVEFQYFDDETQLFVFSDEVYNQHHVPLYLFRGHVPLLQAGARFTLFMDGERYIRLI